jgi:hypothetical protein
MIANVMPRARFEDIRKNFSITGDVSAALFTDPVAREEYEKNLKEKYNADHVWRVRLSFEGGKNTDWYGCSSVPSSRSSISTPSGAGALIGTS